MVKAEDIMFWILIALIVGVALWKIVGSPTDTAALISVALFVSGSELIIWRTLFDMDKKTSIGFVKIRGEIDNKFSLLKTGMDNNFNLLRKDITHLEGKLLSKKLNRLGKGLN